MPYRHLTFTIHKDVYCVLSDDVRGYMFRQLGCHPQDIKLHKNMITIVSIFLMELQILNTFYFIQHNGMFKVTKCILEFKSSYVIHICQNAGHIYRHLQLSRPKL